MTSTATGNRERRFPIPFLRQVAEHYRGRGDVSDKCFIFPNRRSIAFFRKYLCEIPCDRPFLLPQMFTINDFFCKAAGSSSTDRVRLLLELYDCYSALNSRAESLDEFVFWGDVILADFNDVDKYLADADQLFTNVADFKQIQDDYSYLTPTQKNALEAFLGHFFKENGRLTVDIASENPNVKARFLQIWNLLKPLYHDFNNALKIKGMAYEGMIYRSLAEHLRTTPVEDVFEGLFEKGTSFVFVGLNALNECEKTLLGKLRDARRAEFCWDWSGQMIRNPQNRSSFFMADNVAEFPQAAVWDADGLPEPNLNIVSVPSSYGQAKRLPDILEAIAREQLSGDISALGNLSSQSSTAIVLPDENLLNPVLNSIPEQISDINVTMGLPLTSSEFHIFMTSVSAIQLHSVERGGHRYYYHKQVWDLFASSVFRKSVTDEKTASIVSEIKKAAKYYIPESDFKGVDLLEVVFRAAVTDPKSNSSEQIEAFAEYQKSVICAFAPAMAADPSMALELEYAKEYYKSINILQDIRLSVIPMTYIHLLGQLLSGVSVHFKGEPLRGLQIMGPLETRALDFRNLIILSSNESVFPHRSVSSSFIPPVLRRGFGLPTYEYQDAVWAYYYYRMISRAENVWMLVDSRTEGLKSGEESRYIKQLEYHFGLPLKRYVVRFDSMKTASVPDIVKTPQMLQQLKMLTLSASSLQNYLSCPAKFCYSTIMKLKSEDQVAEVLDSAMFGTVYHETMRSLYTSPEAMSEDFEFPDKGSGKLPFPAMKKVTPAYIREWTGRAEDIKSKIKALICSQIRSLDVSGRNLVVADVILSYVMKTLKRDLEILQKNGSDGFEIIGQELKVEGNISGQNFMGYIDRLDCLNDAEVRIVDYKTGLVLDEDYNIDSSNAEIIADRIFEKDIDKRPKIALQFAIYDMLVKEMEATKGRKIINSVYSTSLLFKEIPPMNPCCEIFISKVRENIGKLLEEIYDIDRPFGRTEDEKTCQWCDFRAICGR